MVMINIIIIATTIFLSLLLGSTSLRLSIYVKSSLKQCTPAGKRRLIRIFPHDSLFHFYVWRELP